ncbi:MAG: hypothetical protein ACI9QN_001960 [Arcticibacterium sp.]|jgi:hypothetical protein
MLSKIITTALVFINISSCFAQNEIAILPVHNPSHLQIKVSANGKCLKDATTMNSSDADIEIKAYSVGYDSGKKLVIPEIEVNLVRGGRLIAKEKIGENGNIKSILELAKNNDIIRFLVNGVYIKNDNQKLELYSLGTVNIIYSIIDTSVKLAMD